MWNLHLWRWPHDLSQQVECRDILSQKSHSLHASSFPPDVPNSFSFTWSSRLAVAGLLLSYASVISLPGFGGWCNKPLNPPFLVSLWKPHTLIFKIQIITSLFRSSWFRKLSYWQLRIMWICVHETFSDFYIKTSGPLPMNLNFFIWIITLCISLLPPYGLLIVVFTEMFIFHDWFMTATGILANVLRQ